MFVGGKRPTLLGVDLLDFIDIDFFLRVHMNCIRRQLVWASNEKRQRRGGIPVTF
jgi:hypothetical protein